MNQIQGHINQDGTINRSMSSDAIVESGRKGKGRYWVKFKKDTFIKAPVVLATVLTSNDEAGQSGTNRTISVTYYSADEVWFGIRKSSEESVSEADRPFNFVAFSG